jgi:mono/diheme cytochrome c family protein
MILTLAALGGTLASAEDKGFRDAPPAAAGRANPEHGAVAAKAGATLYATHCASCHGVIGEGGSNIPSLAQGPVQSAKDGEIFWFLTKGNVDNGMPAWDVLPEGDRWRLVSFIKTMPGLT